MLTFTNLYNGLSATKQPALKAVLLERYFAAAPPGDAAWAAYLLTGCKPACAITPALLVSAAAAWSALPPWIVMECSAAGGDLAEACALLPAASSSGNAFALAPPLHEWMERRLPALRGAPRPEKSARLAGDWRLLPGQDETAVQARALWNRLARGTFRSPVSRGLVERAVARSVDAPPAEIARRMHGDWEPSAAWYESLAAAAGAPPQRSDALGPLPTAAVVAYTDEARRLGEPAGWLAVWEWRGARAQIVRANDRVLLWTPDAEIVSDRFPEIARWAERLPVGTVLDGALVEWSADAERPVMGHLVERRLAGAPAAVVTEPGEEERGGLAAPHGTRFVVYDLLRAPERAVGPLALSERREVAAALLARTLESGDGAALLAEALPLPEGGRAPASRPGADGVLLLPAGGRAEDAPADWLRWTSAGGAVLAVLLYAQASAGRQEALYSDFTLGVRHEGRLVAVAKLPAGQLSDEDRRKTEAYVKRHTVERFGPVRTVTPALVFELRFGGVLPSARHKSGLSLLHGQIGALRGDASLEDVGTLAALLDQIDPAAMPRADAVRRGGGRLEPAPETSQP